MIWDPDKECIQRDRLQELQLERLQETVARVAGKVPFYRRQFAEMHIDPKDIKSLDDIRRLPFTVKQDLRDNYPYGLFAVPLKEVVRIHSSSGTTGQATVVGYTRKDLGTWANLLARIITAAGVSANDVVQIAFGYGLFTGGFGLHYGCEAVGASVIPISSGNTRRQLQIMRDFKSTALVCTPSYSLILADAMRDMGMDKSELSLRYGLFGGEPWSEGMRREIHEKLGIVATDNYGLSEVMGPGLSGECLECNGLHINEDHFLVEVLDPVTLDPVPEGEVGELVVTPLTREAFPVIRYRTRDLSRILPGECPCGRTFRRMERVLGRSDDMLIIKGVNVFPMQIEKVLFEVEGTEPHYQIIVEREHHSDRATVLVEATDALLSDQMRQQKATVDHIKRRLNSELGINVEVRLVEERSLERSEGKARRVIDRRTY
ncbi:phenylacetate--CoA ligase family protein [Desulfobulbus oralis]|uniref:Phenylacetate-coenzyme A ligase n=1 Tax=Desulfobulbus oralis TaxID=1986146 RepID=A0A2L1GQ61_9BACT|nr:phenylacetate--CoA ligase [Desulfobulbus oralis]AVD71819.1 phenylacetate--CoA ligase [Desulfobulbus oralis]